MNVFNVIAKLEAGEGISLDEMVALNEYRAREKRVATEVAEMMELERAAHQRRS